ncbi:MAG TPA: hypothetical protein VFC84_04510 [Desulfosporosinus sp.]|nr:hypothetical protein [Desulfosporosinus sp.]
MKIIIYNKKGFWSGVFFLVIAIGDIILMIIAPNPISTARMVKRIFITIVCVLIGLTQVYRGLSRKCTKEDQQNDDERNKLVMIKAGSSAFIITFNFCLVLAVLLLIAVAVTKSKGTIDATVFNSLIGIFIGVSIVPTIMFFSYIGASIYHDKRT